MFHFFQISINRRFQKNILIQRIIAFFFQLLIRAWFQSNKISGCRILRKRISSGVIIKRFSTVNLSRPLFFFHVEYFSRIADCSRVEKNFIKFYQYSLTTSSKRGDEIFLQIVHYEEFTTRQKSYKCI